MRISVIIPNYNSPLIDQVILHLDRQTQPPDEIIVVGHDQPGRMPTTHPRLHWIKQTQQLTPTLLRNRGAAVASGEILCFLDADCFAAPQWLAQHLQAHQQGALVVCGGVTTPAIGYWAHCDNLAALGSFSDQAPAGPRQHFASLNLSIRRELFQQIGGFSPNFLYIAEDTDLSLRLRQQGIGIQFEPHASVAHHTNRRTSSAVWWHLYQFGRHFPQIYHDHHTLIGPSLRMTWLQQPQSRWLAAQLFALSDTLELVINQLQLLRTPSLLPGILWGRLGYYHGVMAGWEQRQNP